ncbi:MAG TPA: c-type cytochrome [Terriglobales bacterium]|nr:c-type cytochrome [Terriglobales bacterium]
MTPLIDRSCLRGRARRLKSQWFRPKGATGFKAKRRAQRLVPPIIGIFLLLISPGAEAQVTHGDATKGAQLYRACAACHSLAPERNMTGPSLAGVWGRKAGGLKSFERYSAALKASGVVRDEKTFDAWLRAPARFVPGNHMAFAGITDAGQRADLIAFLKEASAGRIPSAGQDGMGKGMGGAMSPLFTDLKKVGPDKQVTSIRICHDSYFVTTADGKTVDFWEPNLRFKTDSSNTGPLAGKPVILPAGMMGDRASIFFASPDEITPFIKHQC